MNPDITKLALDLGLAAERAPKEAEAATRKRIAEVSDTMRSTVAVDTGATRDSISDEVTIEQGRAVGESGPTTPQALFIEWGTSEKSPQAFAGPALFAHSDAYEADVDEIARRLL